MLCKALPVSPLADYAASGTAHAQFVLVCGLHDSICSVLRVLNTLSACRWRLAGEEVAPKHSASSVNPSLVLPGRRARTAALWPSL